MTPCCGKLSHMAPAGKLSGEKDAPDSEFLERERPLFLGRRWSPSRHGKPWTEEEMLVAFQLYQLMEVWESRDPKIVCPTGRPLHRDEIERLNERLCRVPEIARVDDHYRREPGAFAPRICNLARRDPKRPGCDVLPHEIEEKIWERFNASPDETLRESEWLLGYVLGWAEIPLGPATVDMPEGREKESVVLVRVNHGLFRRKVLNAYGGKCCVTGIADSRLLEASHIAPWSRNPEARLDPRNGLCLNALHHLAFDRGLISIHPADRVVLVSPSGMETDFIAKSKGVKIRPPEKFPPNPAFLNYHYRKIFRRRERHDAGL